MTPRTVRATVAATAVALTLACLTGCAAHNPAPAGGTSSAASAQPVQTSAADPDGGTPVVPTDRVWVQGTLVSVDDPTHITVETTSPTPGLQVKAVLIGVAAAPRRLGVPNACPTDSSAYQLQLLLGRSTTQDTNSVILLQSDPALPAYDTSGNLQAYVGSSMSTSGQEVDDVGLAMIQQGNLFAKWTGGAPMPTNQAEYAAASALAQKNGVGQWGLRCGFGQ